MAKIMAQVVTRPPELIKKLSFVMPISVNRSLNSWAPMFFSSTKYLVIRFGPESLLTIPKNLLKSMMVPGK